MSHVLTTDFQAFVTQVNARMQELTQEINGLNVSVGTLRGDPAAAVTTLNANSQKFEDDMRRRLVDIENKATMVATETQQKFAKTQEAFGMIEEGYAQT